MSHKTLVLVQGNVDPIDICFVQDDGVKEVFTGIDAATMYVRPSITGTPVLIRTVLAGNLSVDALNAKLVATLSQGEANALVPGVYIGQASARQAGDWKFSISFQVEIKPSIAGQDA